MKRIKIVSALLIAIIIINMVLTAAFADGGAFELISSDTSEALGGTIYYYRHKATGAEVIYNDNGAEHLEFAIGFKTPPADSKGANHVLEHALFCGSEKYPTKNLMHYIQNGTSSLILNGVTADDCTYYLINTENQTEYFNMIDVYLNGIFQPLFLTDENIFRQQGIRIEYADGKAQYNGVVYNELRIKNLDTEENSVNFLSDMLYKSIYSDTAPAFSAGGELDAIKALTYEDLLRVYHTYYIPSNSMTYLSGNLDIEKALGVLDGFFSQNNSKAPSISFPDTKQAPAETIKEYNIDNNTKTVDIGFMSSGVPASAEATEKYARDILFDIVYKRMKEEVPDAAFYTSGGNSGGVFNLALLVSEVPTDVKDEVIAAYRKVLRELAAGPIDETEIDTYIENQRKYFYANWENVFNGLMYQGDPTAYTEIDNICEYLKSHKEVFVEILKKYFTENPCSVIVVSGNGSFGAEDSGINLSSDELEKIKADTEAFQKWNDAPDAPEVIDKIPFLTLGEVEKAPEKIEPILEEMNGISFYYTEKESNQLSLYFPLAIGNEDFFYTQLLHYFLDRQAEKAGLRTYTMLMPMESAKNPQKINPQLLLGIYGDDIADGFRRVIDFVKSEEVWDADELAAYLSETPQKILESYYDPYFVSNSLHTSALSAGGRFEYLFPQNTFVGGSIPYYHFLQGLDQSNVPEILAKIKSLARNLLLENQPVMEYLGAQSEYENLKKAVTNLYANAQAHESASLSLPVGYFSAATITRLTDANHFMITAPYEYSEYSGKLAVLGKVLNAKYITPTMRGKYGAYGASVSFYDTSMTSVATGLADIDLAISVWQGMGDYLRNMQLTQKELNAFVVSAVEEYDEWDYTASESGALFALTEKSTGDPDRIRNEMLSTTVADIKGYADFVDNLVSQMRVFAVLGKSAADNAKFDFAYYADADTLSVTPQLTRRPNSYIRGKTDKQFAPDDSITRAEAAAIISRVMADCQPPECENGFSDVSEKDWYYNDVLRLLERGVLSGYEGGAFLPKQYITRAEFASVLARFIFRGNDSLQTQYSDLSAEDWYCPAMAKMINGGYIRGYEDGSIKPNESITRAEAVTIINRMLGLIYDDNGSRFFDDVTPQHWAYVDIMAAAN